MTTSLSKSMGGLGLIAAMAASSSMAQAVSVPSGTEMKLFDVIFDQEPPIARFRFVAPDISPSGRALQFSDVLEDFEYLCADVVLPALAASNQSAQVIVISLSEREIAFGEVAPDVVQFFQPFDISNGTCMWEEF